jgi:hypothetical protein
MKKLFPLLAVVLVAVLSSCIYVLRSDDGTEGTVSGGITIRFGVPVADIINSFEPDRGRGAVYGVGERIRFRVNVDRPGFITLVVYDNDGAVFALPSEEVGPGTNILPTRVALTAAPPRGRTFIRAIFSNAPRVYEFTGRFTRSSWDNSTRVYLGYFPQAARDVAETFLDVR